MVYDETMSALNMSEDEKRIVEHLFKGQFPDLRNNDCLMISHSDRIWFDPEGGTGVSPLTLIRFLRNVKPETGFEDHEMFECRYHLEFMPSDLHALALQIYKHNRKADPVNWKEEGF